MKALRYERCEQCGEIWNVSTTAKLLYGKYYICPKCDAKNRKGGQKP